MNDTSAMQVADSRQHLFDETGTFGFRVTIVRLLIEANKEFTTEAEFLDEANFRMTLVDFFETNNVGVIQLQTRVVNDDDESMRTTFFSLTTSFHRTLLLT